MMQDACYWLAFANHLKKVSHEIISITPVLTGCNDEYPRWVDDPFWNWASATNMETSLGSQSTRLLLEIPGRFVELITGHVAQT